MQLCYANGIAHVQASLLESWIFRFRDESSKKFNCLEMLGWPYVFFFGSASLLSLLMGTVRSSRCNQALGHVWLRRLDRSTRVSVHIEVMVIFVWVKACICWSYDII